MYLAIGAGSIPVSFLINDDDDKIKYSLKATKTIREGKEVMWCYGTEFDRGSPPYKTGCPD